MKYKLKICVEAPLKKRKLDYDALDLFREVELPWLPRKGDWIAPVDGDDMMKVESLYWSPAAGFSVWVEFNDGPFKAEAMIEAGWKELKA